MRGKLIGKKSGVISLACLTAVLLSFTPAAAKAIGKVTLNYIEASTSADRLSNQVSVYVTVSDPDEKTIQDLEKEVFDIIEDGRPVAIDRVSKATGAMSVILAIDTSGSMQARDMSGRTSMDAAKSAAIEFISLLGSQDRVAFYAFNNEPDLRMDFSSDHPAAIGAVQKIAAKHNAATCLYDTIYEAIKKAAEIPKGRRAIILLTDGKDEKGKQACSRYTANDVIDAATTKTIRVPIYTIGAGPRVDERELGRIASFTGGRYLQAASMDELSGFFKMIAGQMRNQYVIKYKTRTPSGEHSLVVKIRYGAETAQDEKRFWSPPLPVLKPPEVAFKKPGFSGPVDGVVALRLKIDPGNTIKRVRYYVGALLKKELTASPFTTFRLDTAGLPGGLHIIRAEVIDIYDQSVSTEITITVKEAPPPPPPVTQPAEPVKMPEPAGVDLNTILVMVGVGVLLIIAVVTGWVLRKRDDSSRARTGGAVSGVQPIACQDDDGDETLFMPDVGTPLADAAATLTVVESDSLTPGKVFNFNGTTRVGRTAKNDIEIPDRSVSRKHVEIYYENNAYHIRDLGSQNGLKVDEVRVSLNGVPLASGARIRLGPQTLLEFKLQAVGKDAEEIEPDDSTKINE